MPVLYNVAYVVDKDIKSIDITEALSLQKVTLEQAEFELREARLESATELPVCHNISELGFTDRKPELERSQLLVTLCDVTGDLGVSQVDAQLELITMRKFALAGRDGSGCLVRVGCAALDKLFLYSAHDSAATVTWNENALIDLDALQAAMRTVDAADALLHLKLRVAGAGRDVLGQCVVRIVREAGVIDDGEITVTATLGSLQMRGPEVVLSQDTGELPRVRLKFKLLSTRLPRDANVYRLLNPHGAVEPSVLEQALVAPAEQLLLFADRIIGSLASLIAQFPTQCTAIVCRILQLCLPSATDGGRTGTTTLRTSPPFLRPCPAAFASALLAAAISLFQSNHPSCVMLANILDIFVSYVSTAGGAASLGAPPSHSSVSTISPPHLPSTPLPPPPLRPPSAVSAMPVVRSGSPSFVRPAAHTRFGSSPVIRGATGAVRTPVSPQFRLTASSVSPISSRPGLPEVAGGLLMAAVRWIKTAAKDIGAITAVCHVLPELVSALARTSISAARSVVNAIAAEPLPAPVLLVVLKKILRKAADDLSTDVVLPEVPLIARVAFSCRDVAAFSTASNELIKAVCAFVARQSQPSRVTIGALLPLLHDIVPLIHSPNDAAAQCVMTLLKHMDKADVREWLSSTADASHVSRVCLRLLHSQLRATSVNWHLQLARELAAAAGPCDIVALYAAALSVRLVESTAQTLESAVTMLHLSTQQSKCSASAVQHILPTVAMLLCSSYSIVRDTAVAISHSLLSDVPAAEVLCAFAKGLTAGLALPAAPPVAEVQLSARLLPRTASDALTLIAQARGGDAEAATKVSQCLLENGYTGLAVEFFDQLTSKDSTTGVLTASLCAAMVAEQACVGVAAKANDRLFLSAARVQFAAAAAVTKSIS
eukprot:TRINITY_DN12919_c0_g1_i1.p1 TRINITY_DN12919_c0_g1~~TRINITY_DN12919_c0_g1_i1.p1  ORF type:complete len:957 (+),score=203.61 TRINITY_DN12919_c0_g1_i1:212-2872(+)